MHLKTFNRIALFTLYGMCVSAAFSIALFQIFVALLFILWIVSFFRDDGRVVSRSEITYFLLAFAAIRILSVIFSVDAGASFEALGKLPLMLVFFPIHSLFKRRDLEKAAFVLVFSVLAGSLFGSFHVLFFGLDRARTTYGGYTGLSLQIIFALCYCLYFMIARGRTRWSLVPAFILLLAGLIATYARSQWLTAIFACLFFIVIAKPKRVLYAAVALLTGILLMPQNALERLFVTFRYGGDSSRLAIWRGSAELLRRMPFFGYGPRTFHLVFPDSALDKLIDKTVWNYHNDFLQVTIESGWLATLLFLILWISVFVLIVRAIRSHDSFKVSAGAILIALFVSSMLNGVFFDPMVMPYIALTLAILVKHETYAPRVGDRILLVRLDRIGDVILTTPLAGLLKSRFPGIFVDMATRSYASGAARLCDDIDEVIESDGSIHDFAKKIRSRRYSMAVLVHSELKGALALALAGVKVRIGTGFRAWSPLLLTERVYRHRGPNRHEATLNAELISHLGIEADSIPPPRMSPSQQSIEFARSILQDIKRPLVAFHPGSGGSVLRFPPKIMGEAAGMLAADDYSIVVTGAHIDAENVREFIEAAGSGIIDLSGKTDFEKLVGILSEVDFFVAQGTGPLHIASALGTPAVAIFPPSMRTGEKRWRPIGQKTIIVKPDLPSCEKCIGERCRHFNCLYNIKPEMIVSAIKELSVV